MLDKFKFGVVVGIVFCLLILSVTAEGMEISYSNAGQGWQGVPVFCKPIKVSDGIPSTARVRLIPGGGRALNGKVYLILKDAESEVFSFAAATSLTPGLVTGAVSQELGPIANTSIDRFTTFVGHKVPTPGRKTLSQLLGGKLGNGKLDGPVSLVGLFTIMRKPSQNTQLKISEIQFDGKTVEIFQDNRNGWYVPEWKEHRKDYEKLTPGFNVSVAQSQLASLSFSGEIELSYSNAQGWGGIPVFCKPIKVSDGVPSTGGVRLMPAGTLNGKVYLILKDGEGEVFSFAAAMGLNPGLVTGQVTKELQSMANTSIDRFTSSIGNKAPTSGRKTLSELLGGKSGNGKLDGPVSLVGLFTVMRKPSQNSHLKIQEIQFDGKTVETFEDNHNDWHLPEWKEYRKDYEKFSPGFKVTIGGQDLTS